MSVFKTGTVHHKGLTVFWRKKYSHSESR